MDARLAKANYDFCEKTIALKENLELSYLELAKHLHLIELNRMYLPNFDTWEDFLIEVKISRATASKLLNIWRRLVIEYKITPETLAKAGGWSVVAEVLPYATSRTASEDWLCKARNNTRSDLRKFLKEAKTGLVMVDCRHSKEEIIVFAKCVKCGDTHRIYPEQLKYPVELK